MQTNLISKIIICLILFAFFSCKSTNDSFSNLLDKHKNFDKYQDNYEGYVYSNENLDFVIEFDSKWKIVTASKDFTEMQKKYADYVSTERSELLFIGQNESEGVCVRCLAEVLGMKLDDYVKNVKNNTHF